MLLFSGIEKSSLVDYEGKVACTLFTAGCNFRCPFCHNSSLVISPKKGHISSDEVMEFLKKRKGILDAVSITGGEPTLMSGIGEFCEKVKELGYLVKFDSNGTNPDALRKLAEAGRVDYFAMDIKTSLDDYARVTGVEEPPMDKIKESIAFLIGGKVDYEFRTTLVKEYHDEETFEKISAEVAGAKNYFLQEFEDRGTNIADGLSPVTKDKAEAFAAILAKTVRRVRLRGYM